MAAGLGVARLGIDFCTGHAGFYPRPAILGSPTVLCDGIPVVRAGDLWDKHSDPFSTHDGMGIIGSPTVFCDGMPVMRIMDPISCGSMIATGSLDVFCG